jgi:hypothetical protein
MLVSVGILLLLHPYIIDVRDTMEVTMTGERRNIMRERTRSHTKSDTITARSMMFAGFCPCASGANGKSRLVERFELPTAFITAIMK